MRYTHHRRRRVSALRRFLVRTALGANRWVSLVVVALAVSVCSKTSMCAADAAATAPTPAQAEAELFGRVLDRVQCEATPTQFYSLYVPSHYDRQQRWPVIFCFDPGAKGQLPVERLHEAAERFGYIVAGSLNSKNGPWEANNIAAQAMIRDVSAHFSIDAQRVYTAGLSGGSRVATAIALSGVSKGVMACGAGFPVLPKGLPDRIPFVYFSTAGEEDFNYVELRRLDTELQERGATHRFVTFNGGHEWAPVSVMDEAVRWFELQAMRSGTKPRDENFLRAEWERRVTQLAPLAGLERWRALRGLAADFEGLADVANFASEVAELGNSSPTREAVKAESDLLAEEERLVLQLGNIAVGSSAKKQVTAAKLQAAAADPVDSPRRGMYRRVLNSYASIARETARGLIDEEQYNRASQLLEMAAMLKPENARVWYDLARARALYGDKKAAADALAHAVAAGFTDAKRVDSDVAFAKIRSSKEFKTVRERLQNSPGEAAVQLPLMKISAVLAQLEVRPFFQPNAGISQDPTVAFLRVETVAPNSGAALAGIAENMEIVAIQGKRLRGLTEVELGDVFGDSVRDVLTLTVREPPSRLEREIRIDLRPRTP